jgi:hypothetical protein
MSSPLPYCRTNQTSSDVGMIGMITASETKRKFFNDFSRVACAGARKAGRVRSPFSLTVRAGARLVFQPPTPYVPPFSVMIHHKSHVMDVQIRRGASFAFRTGPDRPARMVGVFCGDCGGAYQQHWLVGARLSWPTPLAAALVVVFCFGLLPCLTRRFLF